MMDIGIAQGIGYCFTYPADYDDAPQDRRWACDIATVKDADGVRRVYATDCRAAVQIVADNTCGVDVPDEFRIEKVRALFADWPTPLSANYDAFNLYHANLASAVRAVWHDWIGDPMDMDDLSIDAYSFTMMRVAMPDKRRTLIAVNYIHAILKAIPGWTVSRAYVAREVKTTNDAMMRIDFGDVRVCVMPILLVDDYVECGSSIADGATGALIRSHGDAGMDWPPVHGDEKQAE